MVPRIIHHVWAGDDPIPAEFERYMDSWEDHHPQWEHMLWGPAELDGWLEQQDIFDRAEEIAPRDHLRFRADVARLEVLLKHGGVYVDTDIECLRPIDPLMVAVESAASAFAGESPNAAGQLLLTNAVMGATPGHRWLRACVACLPRSVAEFCDQHIARMVGPWHITRAYEQIGGRDVAVLGARTFFPQSIEARDRGEPVDLTGAYGWHRWSTTRDKRVGKGPGNR